MCGSHRRATASRSDSLRTMDRTLIADLGEHIDERVEVRGWVQAIRDQKRIQFVILRDRTGLAQAALAYVPRERLILCTNCGMAPMPRHIAYAKLGALARGAQLARTRIT